MCSQNVFLAYVLISYCSFSSLIFFMIGFYILSTRFFLKRKELSCATVVSITKKENAGFIQAFFGICPRLNSKLQLFSLTSTLKTATYPPDPISKSVLFPLTLVSVIWLMILNWSKQELMVNLTAGSKK